MGSAHQQSPERGIIVVSARCNCFRLRSSVEKSTIPCFSTFFRRGGPSSATTHHVSTRATSLRDPPPPPLRAGAATIRCGRTFADINDKLQRVGVALISSFLAPDMPGPPHLVPPRAALLYCAPPPSPWRLRAPYALRDALERFASSLPSRSEAG